MEASRPIVLVLLRRELVGGWKAATAPGGWYSCSGTTSSHLKPWKPERQVQTWGRLQEPLFWHGGSQTAEETQKGN